LIELFMKSLKAVKRLVIATIGFTLLLIGVAMIVLPGPAVVIIPVSLGILATEFIWAKKLMKRAKNLFSGKKKEEYLREEATDDAFLSDAETNQPEKRQELMDPLSMAVSFKSEHEGVKNGGSKRIEQTGQTEK
jgi:hypothetical protein